MTMTVVVDGGGSGCRLAAYDAHGTLRATAANGPASLSLGEEQAWLHISGGLSTLANQLGESVDWLPQRLCLGLSGALQNERRRRFLALLPQSITPILITDGHAQLLGATGGQPGACLAVGTGSVLHWLDESEAIGMAGGWGFPMGDEGSGAWLGFQLINAYVWHRDSHRDGVEVPLIFQLLEERIGREVSDIQAWSTNTRSTELASLAPLIVSAAENDDELSNSLLERGTQYCERLLSLSPGTLPIYMVGGLGEIYRARLGSSFLDRCQRPHGDAFSGLYTLSQSNTGSEA